MVRGEHVPGVRTTDEHWYLYNKAFIGPAPLVRINSRDAIMTHPYVEVIVMLLALANAEQSQMIPVAASGVKQFKLGKRTDRLYTQLDATDIRLYWCTSRMAWKGS
jgi:hypothetical protein